MDLDWEHYHRFNVILLTAVGLWPHRHTSLLRLQRIFTSVITVTCFACNLATFVTMDYNKRLLLKNAPTIFIGVAMLLKYVSYRLASDCIKAVTKSINGDWKDLWNKEESRIIEKYVERGKFHTKGFALFVWPVAICVVLAPFSSMFLDIIKPLEESRKHTFPIMFEPFFFDQQKHFFVVALIFDVVIIFGALIFVSTETLLIVYVQHACALFEVTSRRIKTFFCAAEARKSKRSRNFFMVAQMVDIHNRAIRHCKILRNNFLQTYLFLLALGTLSLSSHLFRCTQTFATRELIGFLTSSLFSIAILGYIFYLNFVLQDILDSSVDVFDGLYNSQWYEFPTSIQKLILFCMVNTIKPVPMDFSSLFHPSYEGFSVILRMVLSYVTALYSFQ